MVIRGVQRKILAFLRQAAEHVGPEEHQKQAWVLHQRAKLLLEGGSVDKAWRILSQVLKLYRQTKDTYGEGRALLLRAEALDARGKHERAVSCLTQLLSLAERHGHRRLVAHSHLELGRQLVKKGSLSEGLTALRTALSESVMLEDRNAEFLAHYWLFKAHESLGDHDRARFELEAAKHFVRYIDDSFREADEIRKLLKD